MKIEDLQRRLEEGLHDVLDPVIPAGLRAVVQLRDCSSASKSEDAQLETWSPEAGDTILIRFLPEEVQEPTQPSPRRPLQRRDFKPIRIKGEPLSATVIRDRR